jgi:hypothetical protein
LILDLKPDQTIYAVGDEFHQYDTRIPMNKQAGAQDLSGCQTQRNDGMG